MADPRFFTSAGPLPLGALVGSAGLALGPHATPDLPIHDVAALDQAGSTAAAYCEGVKFRPLLSVTRAGLLLLREADLPFAPPGRPVALCPQPQLAFAAIAQRLYPQATGTEAPGGGFDVHPSAQLGADVALERHVVIGAGAEIGPGTRIGANSVIGRGVALGRECQIGPNVSIGCTLVGDRVVVHAGSRIGQDGFGYVRGARGHVKLPQLGRVIIQDDVEIGANVCIDRGALGDTVIGEGAKIDNLVQIGHNCRIGRGAILVSQVGLSGSVTIGDFAVLGGKVGVADHVAIGDGAMVAARSGVTRALPGGAVYGGFPARPVAEWRREVAALARLAKRNKG